MKNYLRKICLSAGVLSLLCSCSSSSKEEIPSYFPFKESSGDKWGLISNTGKIIVEDEYKEQPSMVVNGMFFVQTEKGVEVYSEKEPTKNVGDIYKSITYFSGEYAPSVKRGEGIKYIDKKGNVRFELPIEYVSASKFQYGFSIITSNEGETCLLDDHFNYVKFKKHTLVSILSKDRFLVVKKSEEETKYYIVDIKETEINQLKSPVCLSQNLKYYVDVNPEDRTYGLKSIDGTVIIKQKYNYMYFLEDGNSGYVAVNGDDGWGIMNVKGEQLIKPKYESITDCKNGYIVVQKDKNDGFGLINIQDERILKFEYDYLAFIPGCEHLLAKKERDKSWYIINTKGDEIAEYSAFKMDDVMGSTVVSDYYDVDRLVRSIFSPTSVLSTKDLFGYKDESAGLVADQLSLSLSRNDISNNKGYEWFPSQWIDFDNGSYRYNLGFDKVVESYEDYSNGYWYSTTKYRFASDSHCVAMRIRVGLDSEAIEHMDQIESRFGETMSSLGYNNKEMAEYNTTYYNDKEKVIVSCDSNSIDLYILPNK